LKQIRIACETKDYIPYTQIVPLQGNYKKLSEKNLDKLCNVIIKRGIRYPSFVTRLDKIYAIDTHQRLKAYAELEKRGYEVPDIPCVFIDAKDKAEAKQLLLECDSRYGTTDQQGFEEFTDDFIFESDEEMTDFYSDLELVGIDIEADQKNATEGDDEAPEVKETAISQTGEIFELGNSLLICGDSTDSDVYSRLLGIEKPDLLFTDPPYGVAIGDKNKTLQSVQKAGRIVENIKAGRIVENIANDTLNEKDLYTMLLKAFSLAKNAIKQGASYYVCAPQGGGLGMMMGMMMDSGLPSRHNLIWEKNNATFSMGRLDYDYRHEPIIYGWLGSHKFYGNGTYKNSVWNIPKPRACNLHPTMKPVELVENAILNSSKEGDLILDIFGGSGTTLIAAEKNNRKCRMIELDPHYCDVIRRRWTKWARENNREVGSGGLE